MPVHAVIALTHHRRQSERHIFGGNPGQPGRHGILVSVEAVLELADGTPLWTARDGVGPPAVLVHGGPGLWDYLQGLSELLASSLTVIRYEQRGCGRSGGAAPYTPDQFVEDLEGLRAALGLTRWTVIGHSWGAELALRYAHQYPQRTRRVVYIGGTGFDDSWRAAFEAERDQRLGGLVGRWRELRDRPARDEGEEREFCLLQWRPDFAPSGDPGRFAAEMYETRPPGVVVNMDCNRELQQARRVDREQVKHQTRQMSVPVLILHGAQDPRPFSATNELLSLAPAASRIVVADAGHAPWVEQPLLVKKAIREFTADET